MATTRRGRTDDEPTNQADEKESASRAAGVPPDDVARRAYQRFEERGREPGHDLDDWLEAERDIKQRRSIA
jgi:hypothetical protein